MPSNFITFVDVFKVWLQSIKTSEILPEKFNLNNYFTSFR
jgi:hypothetical protein